jgi:Fic family protein
LIRRANRALTRYEGVLYGVPNAELLLSPLTAQEAVLSSRIEGTQATLGDVLKFEAGEPPKSESKQEDIQEILNYRKALRTAERSLPEKPFTLNLLKHLHEILLDSVRGRDKARGQFPQRRLQNWIGKPGTRRRDRAGAARLSEYICMSIGEMLQFQVSLRQWSQCGNFYQLRSEC